MSCCTTEKSIVIPDLAPVKTHKWAKEIKAFVDGQAVQWRTVIAGVPAPWLSLDPYLYKLQSFDHPDREFRIAPPRVEKWANLYESSVSGVWSSREMAEQIKTGSRLAFIKLTFEGDAPVAVELVQA